MRRGRVLNLIAAATVGVAAAQTWYTILAVIGAVLLWLSGQEGLMSALARHAAAAPWWSMVIWSCGVSLPLYWIESQANLRSKIALRGMLYLGAAALTAFALGWARADWSDLLNPAFIGALTLHTVVSATVVGGGLWAIRRFLCVEER